MRRALAISLAFVAGLVTGAHSFGPRAARQPSGALMDCPSRIEILRPVPNTLDFETTTLHPYRTTEGGAMKFGAARTTAGRPHRLRVEQDGRCFEIYAEVRD